MATHIVIQSDDLLEESFDIGDIEVIHPKKLISHEEGT
jgi:hypothetical protein